MQCKMSNTKLSLCATSKVWQEKPRIHNLQHHPIQRGIHIEPVIRNAFFNPEFYPLNYYIGQFCWPWWYNCCKFLLFILKWSTAYIHTTTYKQAGNYAKRTLNPECPEYNDYSSCNNQCFEYFNVTTNSNGHFIALPPSSNNCTCFTFQGEKTDYSLSRVSSGFKFDITQNGSGLEVRPIP